MNNFERLLESFNITESKVDIINDLVKKYNDSGRSAHYYPKKKTLSIDGRGMKSLDDGIAKMKSVLSESLLVEQSNEYVIWGVPDGKRDEEILYTQAKNANDAKKVMKILTDKYKVTKIRLQIIDFSTEIDFKGTVR